MARRGKFRKWLLAIAGCLLSLGGAELALHRDQLDHLDHLDHGGHRGHLSQDVGPGGGTILHSESSGGYVTLDARSPVVPMRSRRYVAGAALPEPPPLQRSAGSACI
jgi:hypothetical protein